MVETYVLNTTVAYGDVDRTESLLLTSVFKLLQEVAIGHANQFGTGTQAYVTRGESWLLNRIAVEIGRYPRYEEALRVETWSRGIKGFKGYREARIYDARGEVVVAATSFWIYINARTKAITRVSKELIATLPVGRGAAHCAELEDLEFPLPDGPAAVALPVTLRYSDIDLNEHLNNTAYLDLLQTGLVRAGFDGKPRTVALRFAKPVPAEVESVIVRLAPEPAGAAGPAGVRFSIENDGTVCAHGRVK